MLQYTILVIIIVAVSGAEVNRQPETDGEAKMDRQTNCEQGSNCELPTCRCPRAGNPGNLATANIPQIVVFSFDDAANYIVFNHYHRLFTETDRRNPNGCPITMTMFVSDEWTDYNIVNLLHSQGHEIGLHSMTHTAHVDYWRDLTREEFVSESSALRTKIAIRGASIEESDIRGWRSPFLQPSSGQFQWLQEEGFGYDATLSITRYGPTVPEPYWPHTLDFGWPWPCNNAPCPTSQPGMWVAPIVSTFLNVPGRQCVYVDACHPTTRQDAYDYLMQNFDAFYNGPRSPFVLSMHAAWFDNPDYLDATDDFIADLVAMDDVYIITVNQMLEYTKDPQPLSSVDSFAPWSCANPVPAG